MKAKDLAKILLEYPDFDINVCFFEKDNSNWGAYLRTFEVTEFHDIGHSDERITLDIQERLG